MIRGLKSPDFDAMLRRLQSSNTKPSNKSRSPVKLKPSTKTDGKSKTAVKTKTVKKTNSKPAAKTANHDSLKAVVKDISKVVSDKDMQTKDVKRRIIDLQSQSAVYNQDISMLLANIAMLESTSYTSLTSSLAAGVDVVMRQCDAVTQNIDKCLLDTVIVKQKDDDIRRQLVDEKSRIEDADSNYRHLMRELSDIETQLVDSNTKAGDCDRRITELEDDIQSLKIKSVNIGAIKEENMTQKNHLLDAVSKLNRKSIMISEDSKRLDRLLATDHATIEQAATDLRKNKRLAEEIKSQISEWSVKSKSMWQQSDELIDTGSKLSSKVEIIKTEIDHFNKDLEHYGNMVTSTSTRIDSLRVGITEKSAKLEKLKSYADDLQEIHARSLHEVKVMRRSICI